MNLTPHRKVRGFLFLGFVQRISFTFFILTHLVAVTLYGQEDIRTDWAVTAQSSPFLEYIGSFNTSSPSPALVNEFSPMPGISLLMRKPRNEAWVGMGLSMSISSEEDRLITPSLDADGMLIPDSFVEEERNTQFTRISTRIWKENHMGQSKLKGLFTRFIGFGVQRRSYEYDPRNPLEALVGDTLSMDTGHSFVLDLGIGLGVVYMLDEQLFISGVVETSMTVFYLPDERYRIVESNAGQVNIVQKTPFGGESSFSMGHRILPSMRIGFIIL